MFQLFACKVYSKPRLFLFNEKCRLVYKINEQILQFWPDNYSTQINQSSTVFVLSMVLILNGNSEQVAHVKKQVFYEDK